MKSIGFLPLSRYVNGLILAGFLNLSACSQPTPATDSLPSSHSRSSIVANSNQGQSLRMIVTFRKLVPYRDLAFVRGMSKKIHAPVTFVSSVSPDTHVYQIDTQPGQNSADILNLLRNIPEVLSVEADVVVKPL